MFRIFLGLSAAAFFAAFGVLATIWPNKVRDYQTRQYMRGLDGLKRFGLPLRWSPVIPHTFMFRLFGMLFLFASALTILALLRG